MQVRSCHVPATPHRPNIAAQPNQRTFPTNDRCMHERTCVERPYAERPSAERSCVDRAAARRAAVRRATSGRLLSGRALWPPIPYRIYCMPNCLLTPSLPPFLLSLRCISPLIHPSLSRPTPRRTATRQACGHVCVLPYRTLLVPPSVHASMGLSVTRSVGSNSVAKYAVVCTQASGGIPNRSLAVISASANTLTGI